MKILVCGATGCVGRAVVGALRSRGHAVVPGARGLENSPHTLQVDFMRAVSPLKWAARLRAHGIDAVVNCVGVLIPVAGQSFERVHAQGPIELFRGAALAGVRRVVQVSALGVGGGGGVGGGDAAGDGARVDAHARVSPYLHSKLRADEALASLPMQWAVLRPSLVYGPRSQSARLFATLASLPLIALPGRGAQQVSPVHVFELAEAIARLLEQPAAPNAVLEIGGARPMAYREMLSAYREALGLGPAMYLSLPMVFMKAGALVAEALPQSVFSRDTLSLLERGNVPARNDLPGLLGRAPSALAAGLRVTPPEPLIDLRVELSPVVAWLLRSALAFMWIYTAAISALLPQSSGVLNLLARCGFNGSAGVAALVLSCGLNTAIGLLTLLRPAPWVFAAQAAAVVGYTAMAAFNMPELTIDHCGPLVKNLPILAAVLLLWLAAPRRGAVIGMGDAARPRRVQTEGLRHVH